MCLIRARSNRNSYSAVNISIFTHNELLNRQLVVIEALSRVFVQRERRASFFFIIYYLVSSVHYISSLSRRSITKLLSINRNYGKANMMKRKKREEELFFSVTFDAIESQSFVYCTTSKSLFEMEERENSSFLSKLYNYFDLIEEIVFEHTKKIRCLLLLCINCV